MCTRITYETGTGTHIVGRSLDWIDPIHTDFWAFPRGMAKNGGVGPKPFTWTSSYGSVVSTMYNFATVDGMNEAGLVANFLYLGMSVYPDWKTSSKPLMSIGAYVQYMLDMCATTSEVVAVNEDLPFALVNPVLPNGRAATGHLAVTDRNGDIAIIEFLEGKPVVHHGPQYTVMTNEPTFDQQLAITDYWKTVGGMAFLPGTNRASDRFARMSFYLNATPKFADHRTAMSAVFSLVRSISVPVGITDPSTPHIGTTLWRTVADTAEMRYYHDAVDNPSVFWADLKTLNLAEGSGARRLAISENPNLAGDVTSQFVATEPFAWITQQV